MQSVVGIFTIRADAERAAERLRSIGIAHEHISFLLPGASPEELNTVQTSDTEQPGMGKAVGGVVGAATGASGGAAGVAVLSMLVPGVGPVVAVGLAAAALFGVGGAVAGAAVGGALEEVLTKGLPKDELFVYEDALRQDRTVLIALVDDEAQAEVARTIMEECGAESLDAARERWWLGLRNVEEEQYRARGRDFRVDEHLYRKGFEAALRQSTRGKSYEETLEYLREYYPDIYNTEPFRLGYARGHQRYQSLSK